MSRIFLLGADKEIDRAEQVVEINQVIQMEGYSYHSYVVYDTTKNQWGITYKLINLMTKDFHTADIIRPLKEKFGIGFYYDSDNPQFMDSFEVAILLQEAQAKANEEADEKEKERIRLEEVKAIGSKRFAEILPENAQAVIVARLKQNESDSQSDYFASRTTRTVILGFSTHKRDIFSEMRKHASNFEETAYLAEYNADYEHREKYSMMAIGAFWFFNLPLRLMPFVERDQFAVEIFLPNGKSIYQTTEIADSLDNILRKDGRVVSVTSFVGLSSPRFHDTYVPQFPSDNFAQFIVNTSDKKATKEILDEYSRKYSDYFPEAYIKFKQMDFSEARYPVEIRVSGEDILTIKQASETLMAEMKKMPELLLIRTNFEENLPGVSIRLNQNETNKLGIDKSIIAMSTALELGDGFPITNIWEKDYPVKVILKSERKQEESFSNIGNVNIPTMGGMSNIPLRQIASISPDWNEGQIVRRNGVRTLSILAEVERGYNEINITNKIKNKIDEIELPEGIKVSYGGMKEADGERLPQIVNGLLITVCLMLFILIFHFKKIALALLTLGSTMLCLLGTSIGMQIMGSDISVTSILGVVSLMGILLRNGIIMLDYAEVLRKEQGLTVEKSAIQAGSRRMRPIFLTSTAAAVGVIPMVIGGSPLWTPLGSVIFFGTLITMVFISTILPVAYSVIFKFKDKELNK